MSELSLTPWQRRRLQRQLRQTGDARVYRRTLALLQVDRGLPLSQVAEELLVSRQSVYNWIREYARDHDPTALADRDRPGRPSYWGEGVRQELRWLMRQTPDRLGYFATAWTAPLLLEELEQSLGVRPCARTLRRELGRLGYVWKRGRYALDPDPALEKKTADPPEGPPPAPAGRAAGPGRDGPAAAAAVAGRLGEARAAV
jgi:transposase